MTDTASLVIKVDSSGADRATRSLDKLDKTAGNTERAANKLGKAWGIALGVVGSAVVTTATREYIRAADAMSNMSAKLKLVTGSTEGAAAAQRKLFELSQATSSDLESTTDLYVKLGQSNKDLAANSELLLGITEKVSKALVISGADAASSAAVIRQFSQAMGAGALRGDEFISVMEGAPRLAQAIADGMGVAVGSLRKLAADGKLTSDVIVKALENQGQVLDREFGEMPLTVGRATQQVRNSLTQLIGDTDNASGASLSLAESIAGMARVLESDETKRGFAAVVNGIGSLISGASAAISVIGGLSDKMKELSGISLTPAALAAIQAISGNTTGAVRILAGSKGGALADQEAMRKRIEAGINTGAADFSNVRDGSYVEPKATDTATKAVKAKTSAVKELTAEEKAWAEFEKDMAALQEESAESTRQYSFDQIQQAQDRADAIEEGRAATQGLIADMRDELAMIGMTDEQREQSIALRYADANATDEQRAAIAKLASDISRAREQEQTVGAFKDAFVDLGVSAAMSLGKASTALGNFADRIKQIAVQLATEKAVQWLINMFGASQYSGWGQANGIGAGVQVGGTVYGGGRAAGGPVQAGQSYWVGEKGKPELFTPSSSGTVTPATGAAAARPVTVQVINNSGAQARTETGKDANGGDIIKVIIDQAVGKVNEQIMRQGGSTNRAIAATFGLSRSGVPVSG